MAGLVYSAIGSLDGYIEDEHGRFDWAMPDRELHAYINDLERSVGTYLLGRRMYEIMAVWDVLGTAEDDEPELVEFGRQWRSAEKIVYSTTLDAVSTERTGLRRAFDADEVRALKRDAGRKVAVAGPGLARHAFAAGLVDEIHLFVHPVLVGAGKPGLPGGVRTDLRLVGERRFAGGVVHLHYEL